MICTSERHCINIMWKKKVKDFSDSHKQVSKLVYTYNESSEMFRNTFRTIYSKLNCNVKQWSASLHNASTHQ